jgi:hypothetical protein
MPITDYVGSDRTWSSPVSSAIYSLDWTVGLSDGRSLSISSIRPDQEMCDVDGLAPKHEGFVNVTATDRRGGTLSGSGLVEIVPASAVASLA